MRFRPNDDMLGRYLDHRLYAKSLSGTERIAELYLCRSRLRQVRERIDQLLDGCGIQNFRNSDFGDSLLSLNANRRGRDDAASNRIGRFPAS